MRELLHPVLLGLLVIAIGVIAHRGTHAAERIAAGQHADEEDAAAPRTAAKDDAEDGASDAGRRLSA